MPLALIAGLAVLAVALIVLAGAVVLVPQGQAYVVERLGRHHRTLAPGLHVLVPFVDAVRHRHALAETSLDVPRVSCRTRDGALVAVTSRLRYRITDAGRASYDVADHRATLAQLAAASLAEAVAAVDLSEANASRGDVSRAVAARMAAQTGAWGIAVLGHEITDLNRQWKESA